MPTIYSVLFMSTLAAGLFKRGASRHTSSYKAKYKTKFFLGNLPRSHHLQRGTVLTACSKWWIEWRQLACVILDESQPLVVL